MKNKIIFAVASLAILAFAVPAVAKIDLNALSGKIVLRVEKNGEAWYLPPTNKGKLAEFLGRPEAAFLVMRNYGVGITNKDLTKIQVGLVPKLNGYDYDNDGLTDAMEQTFGTNKFLKDTDADGYNDKEEITTGHSPLNADKNLIIDPEFAKIHKGKIFLQVESLGEAWYVNPTDGKRYFLGTPADALSVMSQLGLGINETNFNEIPVACAGIICFDK